MLNDLCSISVELGKMETQLSLINRTSRAMIDIYMVTSNNYISGHTLKAKLIDAIRTKFLARKG